MLTLFEAETIVNIGDLKNDENGYKILSLSNSI
jgi:hypothetical protein